MEACQRLGLQFLDGTVAFARLSLYREMGRLALRRTYVFDYTANSIQRSQGFVILTGRRVESVGYASDVQQGTAALSAAGYHGEPHPVQHRESSVSTTLTRPPATNWPPPPDSSNVLDFQQWLAKSRKPSPPPAARDDETGDERDGEDHRH